MSLPAGDSLTANWMLQLSNFNTLTVKIKVKVNVTLRLEVYRQSVRLGAKLLQNYDSNFFFQPNTCGPYVTFSLEDGSVVYNCCWPSPAQWFLGLSPAGLTTIFYCHRLETPPTWRARSPYLYPPGTGWPSYTPGTGFPFPRLLRLAGLRWRYSTPPPHGHNQVVSIALTIQSRYEPHRKHRSQRFFYCCHGPLPFSLVFFI
jgi:hypothetical protein